MANISLSDATKNTLIELKENERETYEDVIIRLIEKSGEGKK
jgi:predicted CopG family antitoxin